MNNSNEQNERGGESAFEVDDGARDERKHNLERPSPAARFLGAPYTLRITGLNNTLELRTFECLADALAEAERSYRRHSLEVDVSVENVQGERLVFYGAMTRAHNFRDLFRSVTS